MFGQICIKFGNSVNVTGNCLTNNDAFKNLWVEFPLLILLQQPYKDFQADYRVSKKVGPLGSFSFSQHLKNHIYFVLPPHITKKPKFDFFFAKSLKKYEENDLKVVYWAVRGPKFLNTLYIVNVRWVVKSLTYASKRRTCLKNNPTG